LSAGATCRRAEENKKRKDERHPKTVANWLFAQTTHVVGSKSNFVWWVACGVQLYTPSVIEIG